MMILQRLYEFAERENLLGDPAFIRTPVACLVNIGKAGEYLGLLDVRKREEIPPKKKGGRPKFRLSAGRDLLVPVRPVVWDEAKKKWKTTDPAASGKEKPAVFLADTIARVLPVERLIEDNDRAKFRTQRSTFWRFLIYAASQKQDEALRALAEFFDRLTSLELQERISADVEQHKLLLSDLCSFAWNPDAGKGVLERVAVRDWWRRFYEADLEVQQEGQYRGLCQVTQQITAVSSSIKSKIYNLSPIGCRAEAYLVTGLQSAESYNLAGAAAGMVSGAGVDGFTRGLNALIANEVGGRRTSVRVGGVLFLFWTRQQTDSGVMALFEPSEEQVKALFTSIHAGKEYFGIDDPNDFFLLVLSGNLARVVVRDYLETRLPWIQQNLKLWFRDLTIAAATKDGAGQPANLFSLQALSAATIPRKSDGQSDWEKLAPDVPPSLIHAALMGDPVPDSLLAACLGRLRIEGNDGFRLPRMALIKLCLNRTHCKGEQTMPESLDKQRTQDPAYVYGRLLAFLARCQNPQDFGTSAQILERFYGTASVSPRSVFPTLLRLNRHHLAKIRDENKGFAFNLEASERVHSQNAVMLL